MLAPKINEDFNAVVYKRATIGPEGTIKQVALTSFSQAPTKDDDPELPQGQRKTAASPLHVIACSDSFTHSDFSEQFVTLSHRLMIDEDILVTVTTADGVYAHTYNQTQWQKEKLEDNSERTVLSLSVIKAKLVQQSDTRNRSTSEDLKNAKSKQVTLELAEDYTLRNDFTVTIEYYGVYNNDAEYTCLYDLYGFTETDDTGYNTICLCDDNTNAPNILALRFVGYGIQLPEPNSNGFSLYIKVHEASAISNEINIDVIYEPDYAQHLEDGTENISDVHKALLLSANNRAGDYEYAQWDSISPSSVITDSNVSQYDQNSPQVQVWSSNGSPVAPTHGISTRYAGPGYTYDAHIWYYWNETKLKQILFDKFNITPETISQSFIGFDSRSGSFLYTFVQTEDYSFIIVSGSNNYHYVDVYQLTDASTIEGLFKTELAGENAAHQYRAKIFRWYGMLYLSDVANGHVYYINKGLAEAPVPVWQDITKNGSATNYLYHEIRVFKGCSVVNASGEDKVYCTEFADLGDVAIKYNGEKLYYVGLAPRQSIDGTGSENCQCFPIDQNNAFKNVLNYYDVDYITQQNTLEMMYRQSAYHIKYLVDHHYKIVYLGPKYSVGYDADNHMYLFLMKDFIHNDVSRRLRIGESELRSSIIKLFDTNQGDYTLNYAQFIVYNNGQEDDVRIACKKDDDLTLYINGQLYEQLHWVDASSSWAVSATDDNQNSFSVLNSKNATQDGSLMAYNAGTISFDTAQLKVYKNIQETFYQYFTDTGIVASDAESIIVLGTNLEAQSFLSLSSYEFLDVDRGVFVVKSPVSGVDGYVRYIYAK